jgi:hypothetical protein
MFHESDTDHRTRDCLIFLESKKKMTQKQNQQPNPSIAKEVNHTSHCHQASQSSSSNQPSYQHHNTHSECQPNYHRYPSPYYQPYNYTPHTSQIHTTQPTITYSLTPLQITYPTTNTEVIQPKTKPNNPPHLHHKTKNLPNKAPISQSLEPSITITRGSNLCFENKRQR